jgi:hypothetical protein
LMPPEIVIATPNIASRIPLANGGHRKRGNAISAIPRVSYAIVAATARYGHAAGGRNEFTSPV